MARRPSKPGRLRSAVHAACCASMLLPTVSLALGVGDAAPALSALQRDDAPLALTSLRGQVVYIDFWASWCAPCRQAMPALEALQRKYGTRGFTVLGVNVDTERAAALQALNRTPISYPDVFDPQGLWAEAFALDGMPSGYLLDRTGTVRYVQTGFRDSDLPKLEAAITRQLGE